MVAGHAEMAYFTGPAGGKFADCSRTGHLIGQRCEHNPAPPDRSSIPGVL